MIWCWILQDSWLEYKNPEEMELNISLFLTLATA